MPLANDSNTALYWFVGVIAAFLLIILLLHIVSFFRDFNQELSYLNSEIARTAGAERRYYLRRRRKLWLSLLPFVKY